MVQGSTLKSTGGMNALGFGFLGNNETPTAVRDQVVCQRLCATRILTCDTKFCRWWECEIPTDSSESRRQGSRKPSGRQHRTAQAGLSPFGVRTSETAPGFALCFDGSREALQRGERSRGGGRARAGSG